VAPEAPEAPNAVTATTAAATLAVPAMLRLVRRLARACGIVLLPVDAGKRNELFAQICPDGVFLSRRRPKCTL
jgi:hypothetical protein